ncbi:hypothetical protein [Glutamicibacter sp. NPDC087344]|uniref:hypothetical protein n=1 Tax=Glutamicibacter sp. NPDC087344 TaxID=3363994 RepID=UPI00381081CD
MKLIVPPAILADRMEVKGFSNRRLAKYAEVAPGTIDNLLRGATKSVNKGRTAELICEALDAQLDLYFLPEISSVAVEKKTNTVREVSGRSKARAGKLRVA